MFAVVVVVVVVALLLLTMISHLLFIQPKTRKELQAACLSYNLNAGGKNADLKRRLTKYHQKMAAGLRKLKEKKVKEAAEAKAKEAAEAKAKEAEACGTATFLPKTCASPVPVHFRPSWSEFMKRGRSGIFPDSVHFHQNQNLLPDTNLLFGSQPNVCGLSNA